MAKGKFAHHHKKAGESHARGDHAAAMHHVGHMMAALRSGRPDEEIQEPSIPDDEPMEANAPVPSLRSRLAAIRR